MWPTTESKKFRERASDRGGLHKRRAGFSLVEVMVAAVIFSLILMILLGIVSQTSALTRHASERISAFQAARAAFDLLTEKISQATLNTYWDYDNPNRPSQYLRNSELHFVVGDAGEGNLPGTPGTGQAVFFQAPLGVSGSTNQSVRNLSHLLNVCGFYIEYGATDQLPAPFPQSPPRYRYQLMQAVEATESFSVYESSAGQDWITALAANDVVPIAENVIFFSVWPQRSPGEDPDGTSLTTEFSYDSRLNAGQIPQPVTAHQMPPLLQLTMIVIDEPSAQRFCVEGSPPGAVSQALENLLQESRLDTFVDDLKTVESNLSAEGINYRVFSARIPIRESKME